MFLFPRFDIRVPFLKLTSFNFRQPREIRLNFTWSKTARIAFKNSTFSSGHKCLVGLAIMELQARGLEQPTIDAILDLFKWNLSHHGWDVSLIQQHYELDKALLPLDQFHDKPDDPDEPHWFV